MKRLFLKGSSRSSETNTDEQVQEAVTDAIKGSNDKIVEIRPANKSRSRGKLLLMLIGVLAVSYWLRKSQKSTDKLQNVASETADQTKSVTEQAAETIQKGGKTMAERVEEGSKKASDQVKQTGENAVEKAEQAGEKVTEKVDESGSSSSGSSPSS